jgi:hypothetical protein
MCDPVAPPHVSDRGLIVAPAPLVAEVAPSPPRRHLPLGQPPPDLL